MELISGIIIGLIILLLLVVVHELGHAIVAHRNGVVIEEFGVGFPPKVWKKKLKNGILLSLNWLPIGGFVKLKGEYDSAREKGDYGAASFWTKTKILLAGVLINWLVAACILTILALVGLPKIMPNQFSIASDTTETTSLVKIGTIVENSPADQAGIRAGDQVVRFAGQEVPTTDGFINLASGSKGKTVEVIYLRDGEEASTKVKLRTDNSDGDGYFGASVGQSETIRATWSAPIVGIMTTGQFTIAIFEGVGNLAIDFARGLLLQFSPDQSIRTQSNQDLQDVSDNVAGPIGILGVIFPQASQAGLVQLLFLTAIISLTLAVMNILPIPGLDGGRWLTMTIFRFIKQPLTKKREEIIQSIGFLILSVLIISITISDVGKLF
jgi:regulator of sigma E protease